MTNAQKRAIEKYRKSIKGRRARKRAVDRYNYSRKGRESRRQYLLSSKGQMAVADSARRRSLFS